jgi:DNA helicase-2/ATP-dependent DNA helicase PcrA
LAVLEVNPPGVEPDPHDPQQQAIEHGDGPCLVLAAPGSGKTFVISRRLARLVRSGLSTKEVLALT